MKIDLYNIDGFNFKPNDKVVWNKKIFKECPFKADEIKFVGEIGGDFVGIKGIRQWWNWWEIVPVSTLKKPMYWIKFYYWYYTRYKRL